MDGCPVKVNNRRYRADIQRMDSPLTDQPPGFVFSSATPPSMPQPVPLSPPDPDSTISMHPATPGIGATPWILGGLCLLICWPLGIPALVTAGIARSAARQSADAVREGNLYEGARLLARSRRYRSVSLGCTAAGVVVVIVLILFVSLG